MPVVKFVLLSPYLKLIILSLLLLGCKSNSTETGNATDLIKSTVPPTYAPIITPTRKRLINEMCFFSEDHKELGDVISNTCDGSEFLFCEESVCRCYPGLRYIHRELKCMVPLGAPCDEEFLNLPEYMDYDQLLCQNGACLLDHGRKICRPETDDGLIIRNFDPNDM